MAKATGEQKRKANRAAAIVAACVVAFSLAFVGLVALLDYLGPDQGPQKIEIADKAPSKTFYVLLIGSDTRKGTALYTGKPGEHAQVDQHADIMTLMRVQPDQLKISLLTIPRDTVIDGETAKINNALLDNDPEAVVDAVERLTGLRADYYMMTTFATFANLVDALGGIDVDVPVDIKVDDPATGAAIELKAGPNQHLNGAQALALARARHEYGENQDVMRQANVRAIEQAIIERVMQYHNVEDIERLLGVLDEDVITNMDLPTLGLEALEFMELPQYVEFFSGTGPYEGGAERKSDGQWVIPDDKEGWQKVIEVFKKGKDPTTVVPLPWQKVAGAVSEASASASASASSASASASASASSASASASSSASASAASSTSTSSSSASTSSTSAKNSASESSSKTSE